MFNRTLWSLIYYRKKKIERVVWNIELWCDNFLNIMELSCVMLWGWLDLHSFRQDGLEVSTWCLTVCKWTATCMLWNLTNTWILSDPIRPASIYCVNFVYYESFSSFPYTHLHRNTLSSLFTIRAFPLRVFHVKQTISLVRF